MSSQTPLHHPTLHRTLIGKPSSTTIEYRNLKYASIPARWKESVPNNTLSPITTNGNENIYDATKFGPSCPQKRGAQAWDLTLLGSDATLPCEEGQGDGEDGEKMDEFECLNVNVTVPRLEQLKGREEGKERQKLPVFVWIHGGGLSMGANSWPQYSLSAFVSHSLSIGKPTIAVSVNYRVGILGFLASRELDPGVRADGSGTGTGAGGRGNLGFKDIALALRWIRHHIPGFGGDAHNITAAGESAGAISLSTLLCSQEKDLWHRVILMSGDVTLRKPRSLAWHEGMYRDQLKLLGIEGLGKEDRVKRLREWDAVDLCQRLPLAQHFCGVVDGGWLRRGVDLRVLGDGGRAEGKPGWCREFLVGDTGHDGTVLKARILDNPSALPLLHTLCTTHLNPSEAQSLLSAYNLLPSSASPTSPSPSTSPSSSSPSSPSLSTPSTLHNILLLSSDLRFHLPSLCAHHGWLTSSSSSSSPSPSAPSPAPPSSRYAFHATNPFSGPFTTLSSHELDVAFLLQNWNQHPSFTAKHRSAAQAMAGAFIGFVYGEGMGAGAGGGKIGDVVVFTDDGIEMLSAEEYDVKFRGGRGQVLRSIDPVKLWRLAEAWQQVRADVDGDEEGARSKAKL